MYEMDQVIDGLYVGNEAVSSKIEVLQEQSITHILVAGYGLKQHFPESFQYKKLDLVDTPGYNIHQHFSVCNSFIDSARSHGGRVLVHCSKGKSRSTTLVSAYLMYSLQMTAPQALQLVKEKHQVTEPNFGFVYQLNQYGEVLRSGVMQLRVQQVEPEDKADCRCGLM